MHLVELIRTELDAFLATGRAIHLAHASRALEEVKAFAARAPQQRVMDALLPERTR
jgi:hypothetical protein